MAYRLTFDCRVEPAGSVVPLLDSTGRQIGTVVVVGDRATATVTDQVFAETLRVAPELCSLGYRVVVSPLPATEEEKRANTASLVPPTMESLSR